MVLFYYQEKSVPQWYICEYISKNKRLLCWLVMVPLGVALSGYGRSHGNKRGAELVEDTGEGNDRDWIRLLRNCTGCKKWSSYGVAGWVGDWEVSSSTRRLFVKRSANMATHCLARASYSFPDRVFNRRDVPIEVQNCLLSDLST